MLEANLTRFTALPGIEILSSGVRGNCIKLYGTKKRASCEVCPRCASKATSGYDSRTIKVRDEPLRNGGRLELIVKKKQWYCKPRQRP